MHVLNDDKTKSEVIVFDKAFSSSGPRTDVNVSIDLSDYGVNDIEDIVILSCSFIADGAPTTGGVYANRWLYDYILVDTNGHHTHYPYEVYLVMENGVPTLKGKITNPTGQIRTLRLRVVLLKIA